MLAPNDYLSFYSFPQLLQYVSLFSLPNPTRSPPPPLLSVCFSFGFNSPPLIFPLSLPWPPARLTDKLDP